MNTLYSILLTFLFSFLSYTNCNATAFRYNFSNYTDYEIDYVKGKLTINFVTYQDNSNKNDYWNDLKIEIEYVNPQGNPQQFTGFSFAQPAIANTHYFNNLSNQSFPEVYGLTTLQTTFKHGIPHPTNNNLTKASLVIHNLPGSAFEHQLKVLFNGKWQDSQGGAVESYTKLIDVAPFFNILKGNASLDNCNETNYSIIKPDITNVNNDTVQGTIYNYPNAFAYDIYRDNVLINPVSTSSNNTVNYTDINGDLNLAYAYAHDVKTFITPTLIIPLNGISLTRNDLEIKLGRSDTSKGRAYGFTDEPNNVVVEQSGCSGELEVKWNYSGGLLPPQFAIWRYSDTNNSNTKTEFFVNNSNSFYNDLSVNTGEKYYYKILSAGKNPAQTCFIYGSGSSGYSEGVGNGVPLAPHIDSVTPNLVNKSVSINWNDNTELESSYKVVRVSGSGSTEFIVAKNSTSYTDKTAQTCENYTYQIKAVNDQCAASGVISNNSVSTIIPANLGTTFGGSDMVTASDGDFGNRIDLNWQTSNRQSETWIITRTNPLTQVTNQIASIPAGTKFYSDNTAGANTLYKYTIQGELDCAGDLKQSNITEDIGFRLAFGTVNGQITYSGGTAVKGVKVNAVAASGASGKSGAFDGIKSYASVAPASLLNSPEISVQAFIRPNLNNSSISPIISKVTGAFPSQRGYDLYIKNGELNAQIANITVKKAIPNYIVGTWLSVGLSVSADSIKLFVNGQLLETTLNTQAANIADTDSIFIGKRGIDFFDGNIDEVKIYNRALSNIEMERTSDVFINPSMNGLVGYWRFDEGFGSIAYDYSKTLQNNNKNHASLSDVAWSNLKPSSNQLSPGAYTDSLGS
jgi:hypothetical protein